MRVYVAYNSTVSVSHCRIIIFMWNQEDLN